MVPPSNGRHSLHHRLIPTLLLLLLVVPNQSGAAFVSPTNNAPPLPFGIHAGGTSALSASRSPSTSDASADPTNQCSSAGDNAGKDNGSKPTTTATTATILDLQSQHPQLSPADTLRNLADSCQSLGIDKFDVYGDYATATPDESYLRRFESEVATTFGMADGVFMPSGTMAQGIALLIHEGRRRGPMSGDGDDDGNDDTDDGAVHGRKRGGTGRTGSRFGCHFTSHLLLHEQSAYSELLGMNAVVLPLSPLDEEEEERKNRGTFGAPPLRLVDVEEMFDSQKGEGSSEGSSLVSTLIIELPHRELGGKQTPWDEVVAMGELCRQNGVAYHCDGARMFEAAAAYNDDLPLSLTLSDVARPFDSVYVSFYKGLGALSGAMLLGDADFCAEARVWLRRFGGNLFTLLPYAVSGWEGFRRNALGDEEGGGGMTFRDKRDKLRRVIKKLSRDETVRAVVTFDPEIPETNMVHGYLRSSMEECQEAIDFVASRSGLRVLSRIREVDPKEDGAELGYRSRFEWTMGNANGSIEDETFVRGWKEMALVLKSYNE